MTRFRGFEIPCWMSSRVSFESEVEPIRSLRLKVEINTDELFAAKLRALYQRKKARETVDDLTCQSFSLFTLNGYLSLW